MRLHLILVFCAAFAALISIANAGSSAPPTTVSEQAREFIAGTEVEALNPKTVEEWQEAAGVLVPPGELTADGERELKTYPAELQLKNIAGAQHLLVTPASFDPVNEKRLVVYAHGGAYTLGRPEDQMAAVAALAHHMRTRVLAIRYPLAWKAPHPAARDLLVAVYRELLKTYTSRHIAMSGDSAGGGLVMSAVLKIRDDGLPMPAVLGLISPWADASKTGDSMTVHDGHDPLISYDKNLAISARLYAGDKDLRDPSVSPIYADFSKGFPPSFISSGTRDLFLSHVARLQRKLTDAGVVNRVHVYEGMWHVFQMVPGPELPEAKAAWRDLANFLERHLAR